MSENTGRKQAGRFEAGQSGNPAGKPKGARHAVTLAVEALLDGQAEKLTQRAIELALAGDSTAMRLVIERICPVRKGRTIQFDLPCIETASDLPGALNAVIQATAAGEMTVDEAVQIAGLLEAKRKALETLELEQRMAALEQRIAEGNGR